MNLPDICHWLDPFFRVNEQFWLMRHFITPVGLLRRDRPCCFFIIPGVPPMVNESYK